ncbi:MAG TPA: hypothetical protein VFY79_03115 [Dehalococcoidia bacterium]|nr:hypothetical protein [Dehalococcoidia bacterium]
MEALEAADFLVIRLASFIREHRQVDLMDVTRARKAQAAERPPGRFAQLRRDIKLLGDADERFDNREILLMLETLGSGDTIAQLLRRVQKGCQRSINRDHSVRPSIYGMAR